MSFWPVTKRVVKDSDIILLILDVRMPDLSRNKTLERIMSLNNKLYLNVFTKIDLVSEGYLRKIKDRFPDANFVSGTKNEGISPLRTKLLIIGKKMGLEHPKIGVVGYPNVGKSAIINALARSDKAKVSKQAGTTKGIQWIKAGNLFILDSPGVVPFEDSEKMLGVMGAKNPEKIRDFYKVAIEIIKMIYYYDKKILENLYGIQLDDEYWTAIEKIGKAKGFLLKGGVIDENRAAMQVVKDWHNGKIKL